MITDRVRDAVENGAAKVVVSDLDGVLRTFDAGLWPLLDAELGCAPGTVFQAVLGNPYLHQVVRGQGTYARWRTDAVRRLVRGGTEEALATAAVERWAATPGAIDPEVRALLAEVREQGRPVFVFTNGTDRVRAEVEALGLADLVGPDAQYLINSAELGAAKPEPEAFERAHHRIEQQLETQMPAHEVLFLDDSIGHIRAAAAFGWRAIHHDTGG